MTQDEGRFGRINPPRRCWAPKPIRPIVPNQIVQEFLSVFAAVCPYLGRLTALILPYANTDMMTLFLQQVADDFQQYLIVMLLDQASWHTTQKLAIPENIRLLPLPPGSPELNPTEHIWEDLRGNEMANQLFDSLDRVEDVLCHGINRLADNPGYLRSLTNFPYLRITL
jgi:transposase